MNRFVTIRLQVEGIHYWPGADSIPEVSFLKHPHRHMFHVECGKRVEGSDREIEIITFKRNVEEFLQAFGGDFGAMSCEMIAEMILERFHCEWVSVSEDDENGALIAV